MERRLGENLQERLRGRKEEKRGCGAKRDAAKVGAER